jgi:hypothetical protein
MERKMINCARKRDDEFFLLEEKGVFEIQGQPR